MKTTIRLFEINRDQKEKRKGKEATFFLINSNQTQSQENATNNLLLFLRNSKLKVRNSLENWGKQSPNDKLLLGLNNYNWIEESEASLRTPGKHDDEQPEQREWTCPGSATLGWVSTMRTNINEEKSLWTENTQGQFPSMHHLLKPTTWQIFVTTLNLKSHKESLKSSEEKQHMLLQSHVTRKASGVFIRMSEENRIPLSKFKSNFEPEILHLR